MTSLGLRMDGSVIRIAAGLPLVLPTCTPHGCQHCGSAADELGTHGLSCRKSQGPLTRHGAANNVISRGLTSAGVPSRLEPSGLCLSNNGRPDRATLVPWKSGWLLTCDFTCPDTFAASHVSLASADPGAVAAEAENGKMSTYSNLQAGTLFTPIAVETAGPIGPSGQQLLWDIGRRLKQKSGNPASTFYLLQHISVAV